ncbi:putative quorum-sensing-regulated virulence factor [endosymbiont of Lamellibrachia barhami]
MTCSSSHSALVFRQRIGQGRLGMLMQLTLEIKINGLEYLIKPLR